MVNDCPGHMVPLLALMLPGDVVVTLATITELVQPCTLVAYML